MQALNDILGTIKPWIVDDNSGQLMFSSEPSSKGVLGPEIEELENYLKILLEGPRFSRSNSFKRDSPKKQSSSEQEIDDLKAQYESQINGLIEQVKSVRSHLLRSPS